MLKKEFENEYNIYKRYDPKVFKLDDNGEYISLTAKDAYKEYLSKNKTKMFLKMR